MTSPHLPIQITENISLRKSQAALLTGLVVISAISLPIALSVHLARELVFDDEARRALGYAHDVLNRSELTADQIESEIDRLKAVSDPNLCSDAHILTMRELALTSSYIQAFAHVSDDSMLCSSFGLNPKPVLLGAVDYISNHGTKVRIKETFPFAPVMNFAVVESDGFAAILNKNLSIDATTQESDASLAVFNPINHLFISQRGQIKPEWIQASDKADKATFHEQDFVVAVVNSQRYELGAVAALPIAYANQRAKKTATLLIPLGAIGGIVIAVAILYMIQPQQGLPSAIIVALKRKEFYLEYQPIVEL
ncbi:phage resistance protein [compost metagenome]